MSDTAQLEMPKHAERQCQLTPPADLVVCHTAVPHLRISCIVVKDRPARTERRKRLRLNVAEQGPTRPGAQRVVVCRSANEQGRRRSLCEPRHRVVKRAGPRNDITVIFLVVKGVRVERCEVRAGAAGLGVAHPLHNLPCADLGGDR